MIYLIIALAWALSLGAGVYQAFQYGQQAEQGKQAAAKDLLRETREQAQQGAAEAIAKLAPVNKTIVQRIQNETQTNVVYRECRHTPDGLRDLNQAITGVRADVAGSGKLPGASAAR